MTPNFVAAAVATAPVAKARVNFGIAQYASRGEGPVLAVAIREGMISRRTRDFVLYRQKRRRTSVRLSFFSLCFIGFFYLLREVKKKTEEISLSTSFSFFRTNALSTSLSDAHCLLLLLLSLLGEACRLSHAGAMARRACDVDIV